MRTRKNRVILVLAALVALTGGGLMLTSRAQQQSAAETKTKMSPATGGGAAPAGQVKQGMQNGQTNMPNRMPGMMMQGMDPERRERMQVLMRTPIFLDGPGPLLAQAEKLGLSEAQKQQLAGIEQEARRQARAVLTPEQRAKLGTIPDKPVTMMETRPMMGMMGGAGPSARPTK
jgi:hypothetical protein